MSFTVQEATKVLTQKFLLQEGVAGVSHHSKELIVYVESEEVASKIPQTLMGYPVKAIVSGKFKTLALPPAKTGRTLTGILANRTLRFRPCPGGVSIGSWLISAGTNATRVFDRNTGMRLFLSNRHVFWGDKGERVTQPGRYDGATENDVVAYIERWVELKPPPDANLADCALALPLSQDLVSDEVLDIGLVNGVEEAKVGMRIKKSGRSCGLAEATVTDVNASVKVEGYDFGEAVFEDTIISTFCGLPGDSGSVAVSADTNAAVGLLFAGCYSEDTRIFTNEGLKYFYELTGNELVLTLNPENENIEWQPIETIHKYPYSGKMILFEGRNYSLLVTPNHRMVLKDKDGIRFVQAADLYNFIHKKIKKRAERASTYNMVLELHEKGLGAKRIAKLLALSRYTVENWLYYRRKYSHTIVSKATYSHLQSLKLRIPATGKWNCSDLSYIQVPGVGEVRTEDWLEFFGWYITEGCSSKRWNRKCRYISFTISDEDYANEIAESIKRLGLKPLVYKYGKWFTIRVHNTRLAEYLAKYGKAREKYISRELLELPPEKLKILLETMMKGDGYKRDRTYNTLSKRLAENFAELAIKCGYAVTFKERNCKYSYKPGSYKKYEAYLRSKYVTPFIEKVPEQVDYSGYVYCVSVPNKIILVERNGKLAWCGNSDSLTCFSKMTNVVKLLNVKIPSVGAVPPTRAPIMAYIQLPVAFGLALLMASQKTY